MSKVMILTMMSWLMFVSLSAQIPELGTVFTPEELKEANTFSEADYLDKTGKEIVLMMNLARMYPKKFADQFLPEFISGTDEFDRSSNYKSLIKDLKKMQAAPPLKPRKELYEKAAYHARDMGETGKIGHDAADGTSFQDRMKPLREQFYGVGENCQYGYNDARYIIVDLLIDEDVPDVGHRKNILDDRFIYSGTAVHEHKKYSYNSVQIFAADER